MASKLMYEIFKKIDVEIEYFFFIFASRNGLIWTFFCSVGKAPLGLGNSFKPILAIAQSYNIVDTDG